MQNEVYFNELCLNNKTDDYTVMKNLKDCYSKLKSEGFSICRIGEDFKQELLTYLKNIKGVSQRDISSFCYSFFHSPFEKESISYEEENKFITHDLYYEENKASGLLWAYTYDTFAFSLLTDIKWNTDSVLADDKSSNQRILIHHASTAENINNQKDWIESLRDVELITSLTLPENKAFKVRHDHGIDVLKEFWDKIKNCEYVESCINSIPFNSHDRKLIKTVKPNGEIELVLYWTDKGLGMCIKTTGRNFRETQKISEILEEKYSK